MRVQASGQGSLTPLPEYGIKTDAYSHLRMSPPCCEAAIEAPPIECLPLRWGETPVILVAGGAGFIGSNFVLDWLSACDESVLALGALTYAGNAEDLASLAGDTHHIGASIGTGMIAGVTTDALCVVVANPELAGTYHLTAAGKTSWYGYAWFVIERARAIVRGFPLCLLPEVIRAVLAERYRLSAPTAQLSSAMCQS